MNATSYDAGVFRDIAESALGKHLLTYLLKDETQTRLQVATDLGKAAVEGIEEQLLAEFGTDVLEDRTKQFIGHVVRHIMVNQLNYEVAAQNVRVNSIPFSRATRYRKTDSHTFHVFRSSQNPRQLCLSFVRSGEGLPSISPGTWLLWKSCDGDLRAKIGLGVLDPAHVAREIKKNGFALHTLQRIFRAGSSPQGT